MENYTAKDFCQIIKRDKERLQKAEIERKYLTKTAEQMRADGVSSECVDLFLKDADYFSTNTKPLFGTIEAFVRVCTDDDIEVAKNLCKVILDYLEKNYDVK